MGKKTPLFPEIKHDLLHKVGVNGIFAIVISFLKTWKIKSKPKRAYLRAVISSEIFVVREMGRGPHARVRSGNSKILQPRVCGLVSSFFISKKKRDLETPK